MTTAVVAFKRFPLNTFVPMITLASPITIVPVPIEISKNLCCWHITLPANATNPFEIASPTIFTNPLSFARDVTIVSLSPTALKRYPDFVFKYRSNNTFAMIMMIKMMITVLYGANTSGKIPLIKSLSNTEL